MSTAAQRDGRATNFLLRVVRVLLFAIALGAIASILAIGFFKSIAWLNELLLVTFASRRTLAPQSFLSMWLFLFPAIGGLVVGLLFKLSSVKRAQNPSDVIHAAQSGRFMLLRAGAVSAVAAIVGAGSGASVGQFSPLVHLGGMIGSAISKLYKGELGLAIGCGVAAAISTVFAAPIAGIIFAHEVVLRHYSLRTFAAITVASATGLFFAERIFHQPPLFEIASRQAVFAPELLAFILIGVSGAVVSVIYMRAILTMRHLAQSLRMPNWLKPALAGLAVGISAQWIPEILGVGMETLRLTLSDSYDAATLSLLLVAKIIATSLCLGFGFAGGVFSPAMLIGILFGALLGNGAEFLYPNSWSGVEYYAICGMAAVASPVVGAPLATILLVFELTKNYELTTAVMVSVVFSNIVAYRLFARSLFDRELSMRGFDLSAGRDKIRLAQISVSECITTDFVCAKLGDELSALQHKLVAANRSEGYIIDAQSRYVGVIALKQILAVTQSNGNKKVTKPSSADKNHPCFTDTTSLWEAMETMKKFVGESIAVVDADNRLLGVVYEKSVVKVYLQTVQEFAAQKIHRFEYLPTTQPKKLLRKPANVHPRIQLARPL